MASLLVQEDEGGQPLFFAVPEQSLDRLDEEGTRKQEDAPIPDRRPPRPAIQCDSIAVPSRMAPAKQKRWPRYGNQFADKSMIFMGVNLVLS